MAQHSPFVEQDDFVAAGGFVVHGLIEVTSQVDVVRFVDPWHWYANRIVLLDGWSAQATLLPLALAAVITTAGVIRFDRRDLR